MRSCISPVVAILLAGLGCVATGTPAVTPPPPAPSSPEGSVAAPPRGPALTPPDRVAPDRRVHAYVKGKKRVMDIDEARMLGLTIVDLSDDWVPYIFWSQTPGQDDHAPNDYLDTYVDLANDRIDVDGVRLPKGAHNYLEVYGIPPSLSVLRKRFLEDEKKECYKGLDLTLFKENHGGLRIVEGGSGSKEAARLQSAARAYEKALKDARVSTLEALLAIPRYRDVAEKFRTLSWRHQVSTTIQQRLICEGMVGGRSPSIKPGILTPAVRDALRRFEQKHNIYGWGLMYKDTFQALGRSPRENNFESFKRVLTERVVSAVGILEDGTAGKTSYTTLTGKSNKTRDLVTEFTQALLTEMGLVSPEAAVRFMEENGQDGFRPFYVAARLPSLPEYYSDHMDLQVVIHRGDVFYDFPNRFGAYGQLERQGRSQYPYLTLYVNYNQQKVPLVRWRTTIGGWQPEMRNGEEYYKYKISDVGPRIWKHIVAGPVWLPPSNTPSRDMVKVRPVGGGAERIVAHNSFGPGYASAYGLVAAFHITESGLDNQVRTHGSVNYMSINSSQGFSHGCHRLYNYRAVRMFSFILRHRPFIRKGQSKLAYNARFEHLGEEFQMDIRTRGYYYELKPPVPVNVLEGNVRGERQEPVEEYVKKPTATYQEDLPTLKSTPPSGAPRVKEKNKENMMSQPQNL